MQIRRTRFSTYPIPATNDPHTSRVNLFDVDAEAVKLVKSHTPNTHPIWCRNGPTVPRRGPNEIYDFWKLFEYKLAVLLSQWPTFVSAADETNWIGIPSWGGCCGWWVVPGTWSPGCRGPKLKQWILLTSGDNWRFGLVCGKLSYEVHFDYAMFFLK